MLEAHLFDAAKTEWTESAQFPGLLVKALETHATHPCARVTLVRLAVGGSIGTHVHELETETAFVLAGAGLLRLGDAEAAVQPGAGVSVPPGLYHSLHNTGDVPLELLAMHTLPRE